MLSLLMIFARAAALPSLGHELWKNESVRIIDEVLSSDLLGSRRRLISRPRIGKLTTIALVHISRTGGLSLNKLLVEQRGLSTDNGIQRFPDCVVPRLAYGNSSVPISQRFDFPNCEVLSAIWPLPTIRAKISFKREAIFITMLRDPSSRVMSQWRADTYRLPEVYDKCKSFEQIFSGTKTGAQLAGVRSCLQKGTQPVQYVDYQTLMIGGCKWDGNKRSCTASSSFDPASLLAKFSFVGILEHFDIAICLLYYTIGDEGKFRKFCKHRTHRVPHQNRAPKPGGDPFRQVFSPVALKYLWLTNRKDHEVYWAAYRNFIRDVSVMEAATNVNFLSRLYKKDAVGGGRLHLDY